MSRFALALVFLLLAGRAWGANEVVVVTSFPKELFETYKKAFEASTPGVKVIILLDRRADLFLAQRAQSDGWLIKPLNSVRLRRAVDTVLAGRRYEEGIPKPASAPELPAPAGDANV